MHELPQCQQPALVPAAQLRPATPGDTPSGLAVLRSHRRRTASIYPRSFAFICSSNLCVTQDEHGSIAKAPRIEIHPLHWPGAFCPACTCSSAAFCLCPFVQRRRIADRAADQPNLPTGMVILPLRAHHHSGLLACRNTDKRPVYWNSDMTCTPGKRANQ
jgi:hypothetical protein